MRDMPGGWIRSHIHDCFDSLVVEETRERGRRMSGMTNGEETGPIAPRARISLTRSHPFSLVVPGSPVAKLVRQKEQIPGEVSKQALPTPDFTLG